MNDLGSLIIDQVWKSPNTLGEILRSIVFKSHQPSKFQIGGLTTFDLNPGFTPATMLDSIFKDLHGDSDDPIESTPSLFYNERLNLYVGYFSDGDSTLYFKIGNIRIINYDCKKVKWRSLK